MGLVEDSTSHKTLPLRTRLGEGTDSGDEDSGAVPASSSVVARIRSAIFDGGSAATRVDRYYLLEEVGRGGLGVVYSAYDPQLGRRVALKLVRPDRVTGRGGEHDRLLREARALAQLTHPNVVAVHDAGLHGEAVFLTMELVEGQTLSDWVRTKAPHWTELRDALVEAGRGLQAAHRAGIVHRDFKPSNVLVGDDGRVRVVDFGLACPVGVDHMGPRDEHGADPGALTPSGSVLGTPPYMAPEQLGGEASQAVDQWAFCVTAYEMFYGRRPFVGESFVELASSIRMGEVPDPGPNHDVPTWMLRVLERGLAPVPADRFEGMGDLLAAMLVERTKRRRRLGLVVALAGAMATGGVFAAVALGGDDEVVVDPGIIDQLEEEALAAAKTGAYVYPPVDAPTAPTAYARVIELESLDGALGEMATARATTLRGAFADELTQMGDTYWEVEGGRGFASDFYAAAVLFDPTRNELRQRTAITLGELAELRRRAASGAFTQGELQGGAVLTALTEPDPKARGERLQALVDEDTPLPLGMRANVEGVIGKARPPRPSKTATKSQPAAVADPLPSSEPDAPPPVVAPASTPRDKNAARRAVTEGRAKLAAGEYADAEAAFHRAIRADKRSHAALSGLSDVYFNRAAHHKALAYAKRAASLAPKRAGYRMQLGDAYTKVLRYDDARREYELARKLGHRGASRALERLQAKLGR